MPDPPLLSSRAVTRIGIIGLGYVGLPLAVAFAEAGDDVLGVDIDPRKSVAIAEGRSYIEDVSSAALAAVTASGNFRASTTPEGLRDRDAIIICLPTPLDEHRNPDLGPVLAGAETAAAHIAPGALAGAGVDDLPGHDARGRSRPSWSAAARASARMSSSPSRPSASIPATSGTASATRPRSWAA